MFENDFNNIDRVMRNDDGLASELDYAEQTSWLLFLKYLDDLESEREDAAILQGKDYAPILDAAYRWQTWAAPKKDGRLDHNAAMTGDDLIAFVNLKLFPYLKKFRETAADADTIEYKVGEIFSEITNKFRSGYSLRDALEIVDTLSFNSQQAKHELSDLYETRIRRMGNAGRNGGEYYTPRPLIRAMIKVVDPKLGETIYDGACGSAGFLCEAWEYMRRDDLSASDWDTLQRRTFFGQEKKSLAYVLGVMNMILHGIEAPSIIDAPNSDIFDVLAYVRFTLAPLTRTQRAEAARSSGLGGYEPEMREFLDYVLRAYETHGIGELAPIKIADFLRIKYGDTNDAKRRLGPVPTIRDAFVDIQVHLFR